MTSTITLDIYSGRENPVLHLNAHQEDELNERLQGLNTNTDRRPSGAFGGLGYRGFRITRSAQSPKGLLDLRLHEGVLDNSQLSANLVDDTDLERWLAGLMGQTLPPTVREHLDDSITNQVGSTFALHGLVAAGCPANVAADAPTYNPAIWNTPAVQPHNNCYAYANNQMTNTFPQPGRASGHPFATIDCPAVQAASVSDGLVAVPNFSAPRAAGKGWYIALVIWPGSDYHWYRQDAVGCWSHKPGQTAARNVDNSGNAISDPRTCDRGPYSNFCTYMVTGPGVHIA